MVRRAHGDTKSLDATTVVVRYLEEDVARAFMSLLPEATEWTGPVNIHGNKYDTPLATSSGLRPLLRNLHPWCAYLRPMLLTLTSHATIPSLALPHRLFPGLDPKVLSGYEYKVVLWDNEDRGFKEGELQFHAQQLPSDDERVLPFRLVA